MFHLRQGFYHTVADRDGYVTGVLLPVAYRQGGLDSIPVRRIAPIPCERNVGPLPPVGQRRAVGGNGGTSAEVVVSDWMKAAKKSSKGKRDLANEVK